MNGLRLGIDLGTSAVKVVLLSSEGRVLADGEAGYPTFSNLPGQAEQDPADWLDAVGRAMRQVAVAAPHGWADRVTAVGLAGQLPTLVCLDQHGPVGRAITWQDSRADVWVSGLLDEALISRFYRETGMPIDGRYLGPLFRHHKRDERKEISAIVSAKDFLLFALTGRTATDPSTASGYATYSLAQGAWDPELCAVWEISSELLPDISGAGDSCGGLNEEGARLLGLPVGTPVNVGCADSVAGALAMTGLRPEAASIAMGSSTIVMASTQDRALDPGARFLLTPHAEAGWYGREMDLLSTGTGFAWLARLLGLAPETLEALVTEARPGASGVSFAPYLSGGEQGALWDSTLRGVIHGMSTETSGGDLARAYMEGVFFEIRRCLDVLGELDDINTVVLSGRVTGNPLLVQLLADVVGRPVRGFDHPSPAAIGAAMLGASSNERDEVTCLLLGQEIAPGAASRIYDPLYRRHLDLFPRIARPA